MVTKFKFLAEAIKRLSSFHKEDRESEFHELLDKSALDVLTNVFEFLRKMRDEVGESEFRNLLKSLDADRDAIRKASDLIRRLDDNGRFISPFDRVLSIIGDDTKRRRKFLQAVYNFTPGQKSEGGGLKEFSEEIRQERNQLASILKEYAHLYRRRLKHRKRKEQEKEDEQKRKNYEKIIPASILSEIHRSGAQYKKIATKWMIKYYPCTDITLSQIARGNRKKTGQGQ